MKSSTESKLQSTSAAKGAIIIRYALGYCDLGYLLVGQSEGGVCAILLGDTEARVIEELREHFPGASVEQNPAALERTLAAVRYSLEHPSAKWTIALDITGTDFQKRVYHQLRATAYGQTRSYQQIAEAIGQPGACRAVGNACAANVLLGAVPCHRVIKSDGSLGRFRGGTERKVMMLEKEKRGL